jgi:hypothetical protein
MSSALNVSPLIMSLLRQGEDVSVDSVRWAAEPPATAATVHLQACSTSWVAEMASCRRRIPEESAAVPVLVPSGLTRDIRSGDPNGLGRAEEPTVTGCEHHLRIGDQVGRRQVDGVVTA